MHFFENDSVSEGDAIVAQIACKCGKVFVGKPCKSILHILVIVPFTDKINFAYPYIVLSNFLFNERSEVGNFLADILLLLLFADIF
ncbi:hypothetical protein D3C81_2102800 [compost metagenome]